jgi:hypothetical protein
VSLLCSITKGKFALASGGEEIGGMEGEGCCLLHNEETGDFVRSGKAVGADRSFLERYKEHKHHATTQGVNDLDSLFYHSYPSKQAERIGDRMVCHCTVVSGSPGTIYTLLSTNRLVALMRHNASSGTICS